MAARGIVRLANAHAVPMLKREISSDYARVLSIDYYEAEINTPWEEWGTITPFGVNLDHDLALKNVLSDIYTIVVLICDLTKWEPKIWPGL